MEELQVELDSSEHQKVIEFLNWVNVMQEQVGQPPVDMKCAVKFLSARKFDVTRAVTLFRNHEALRDQYKLRTINPISGTLKDELESGKFTIVVNQQSDEPQALAIFTARKHNIHTASHEALMKCIIFQLDCALHFAGVQRKGLTLIYDMTGSSFAQFDYTLSRKLLQLLQDGYPARLKKIYILKAPLWFKGPLKIVSPFLKRKFLERLRLIEDISQHLSESYLPSVYGGNRNFSHKDWVMQCIECYKRSIEDNPPPPPRPPPLTETSTACGDEALPLSRTSSLPAVVLNSEIPPFKRNRKHSPPPHARGRVMSTHEIVEGIIEPAIPHKIIKNEVPTPRMPLEVHLLPPDQGTQAANLGEMSLPDLQEHLTRSTQQELQAEYMRLRLEQHMDRFTVAKLPANIRKNRYSDILSYDHTRVKLQQLPNDQFSDYINANYVDGYNQERAFIFTQGPLPHTIGDFWRMVWEQGVYCIVMTTKCLERGRTKCGKYWPDKNTQVQHGFFVVSCTEELQTKDYVKRTFTISFPQVDTEESREVVQFQYLTWPDFGTPPSAEGVLDLLHEVRQYQAERLAKAGPSFEGPSHGPPIVVHCSAGVGRSGTFAAIDICMSSILYKKTVNVMQTVRHMRSQRAHSIQTPDQYIFIYTAVVEQWEAMANEDTSSISSSDLSENIANGNSYSEL
ncbi:hypothetical protein ACHWQZ_G010503 [Mnemiopsis leidyi]